MVVSAVHAGTAASVGTARRSMAIRRTEFGSGLRVVTERMPSVRSVALGLWVLAGSRDEPPPISGAGPLPAHPPLQGPKRPRA